MDNQDKVEKDNKSEKDGEHNQPRVKHLKERVNQYGEKINVLEQKPEEEKKEFNHIEYARMLSRQLKEKKTKKDMLNEKKDKRPLLNASKEAVEDKRNNPKGHKGRIK